jgi:hypothetical protein
MHPIYLYAQSICEYKFGALVLSKSKVICTYANIYMQSCIHTYIMYIHTYTHTYKAIWQYIHVSKYVVPSITIYYISKHYISRDTFRRQCNLTKIGVSFPCYFEYDSSAVSIFRTSKTVPNQILTYYRIRLP